MFSANSPVERQAVLLLTDHLKVGGLENVVVRLAAQLLQRGFRVGVAASREGSLWEALPDGCSKHYLPNRGGALSSIRIIKMLRQVLKAESYGIIHSHQRGITLLAQVASIGLSNRVVEHVHNVFIPADKKLLSFRASSVIACGSAVEKMLLVNYARPASRTHLVLNGVPDLSLENSGIHDKPSFAAPIRIIGVGRLSQQKNPMKFIDIIESLNNRGIDLQAEWIGGGELLEECRQEVISRRLSNVAFLGTRTDVAARISRSDVLLMTSRWEGLPLAILEAMSLGVGAILPDVGSCRDAVSTDYNGHLYPPDMDIKTLTDTIEPYMDRELLTKWGQASRIRYRESFTLDRMVDDVINVYKIATKD